MASEQQQSGRKYENSSAALVQSNVIDIRKAVTGGLGGGGADGAGGGAAGGASGPVQHSQGMAVQSVAQSMAILIQDTADLFRNIGTIESTAIGTATAKWLADPYNPSYQLIIQSSTKVLNDAATLVGTVGETAAKVLAEFPKGSGSS